MNQMANEISETRDGLADVFARSVAKHPLERFIEGGVGVVSNLLGDVGELAVVVSEELNRLLHSPFRDIFKRRLSE